MQHFPVPGQQGRFALPQGPAEVGVFQRGQQVAGICPLVQSHGPAGIAPPQGGQRRPAGSLPLVDGVFQPQPQQLLKELFLGAAVEGFKQPF
ncbi:Translation initiation factor 2, partial [Dysosmobacter welbionis]